MPDRDVTKIIFFCEVSLVYLDYTLIIGRTVKNISETLKKYLKKRNIANLKINPFQSVNFSNYSVMERVISDTLLYMLL